ncbi:carboxylesterase [Tropicimonas sp. IMCC34011]|uniref:alpha/beta hydrolase n=1 Tax=Tropicimonas sp. IMCC34011 TaxID=2248759 RepID=UPI000E282D9B|nr:alpha/beta hydrolase [Tropicimonas sp. IMCC34011]
MRAVMWVLGLLCAAVLIFGLAWGLGPREPVRVVSEVDAGDVPETNLSRWLDEREDETPDLRDDARKEVVWHGEEGGATLLSVVYLHGFSASPAELRPVPDLVAAELKANLFLMRFKGHGRDGAAMAEATAGDYVDDVAEALIVGRRLGERVLVLATSTGGAALTLALSANPDLRRDLHGVVMMSPNFRMKATGSALLTWPFARTFVPVLLGDSRGFDPQSETHAAHWTETYPSRALMPMAALVKAAREADVAGIEAPALFLVSPTDTVVSPEATREMSLRWGGPATFESWELKPGDDPDGHVLGGRILSPGSTEALAARIAAFAGSV